jgi:hypothetical protein
VKLDVNPDKLKKATQEMKMGSSLRLTFGDDHTFHFSTYKPNLFARLKLPRLPFVNPRFCNVIISSVKFGLNGFRWI